MSEKFNIEKNTKYGRYAVAAEDLKAGDIIFEETPFVYGPKSDTSPLCLGCHAPTDCSTLCTECNWPVCGLECQQMPIHHNAECQIFKQAGIKFDTMTDTNAICLQYECITPLRMLLEKTTNPTRWLNEIESMESHTTIRKNQSIWQYNQINIVNYIRGPLKLAEQYDEALIHQVCGLLDVNAYEAKTPSGYPIRCLYPKLSIISHSCVSNIIHSIDGTNNYHVQIRATIDLKKNQQFFNTYTYTLLPTFIRRDNLKITKYFDCDCDRCQDNTELGTHLGTLKCNKCDNGLILSTEPLNDQSDWKCDHCEFKTTSTAVKKVYQTIQNEIDEIDELDGRSAIEAREKIFRRYRSILHPKHALMTNLRINLSQLYGRVDDYTLDDMPDILLEHKIELCEEVLDVLNVLEPGLTRIRGLILYELHAPLMLLARHQYNYELITKLEFREKLEKCLDTLGKSVEILIKEPKNTAEGQLGEMAKIALENLKNNFDLLVETA